MKLGLKPHSPWGGTLFMKQGMLTTPYGIIVRGTQWLIISITRTHMTFTPKGPFTNYVWDWCQRKKSWPVITIPNKSQCWVNKVNILKFVKFTSGLGSSRIKTQSLKCRIVQACNKLWKLIYNFFMLFIIASCMLNWITKHHHTNEVDDRFTVYTFCSVWTQPYFWLGGIDKFECSGTLYMCF